MDASVTLDAFSVPNGVAVILQPTMLTTADAITDFTKRTLGPRTIFNPYVNRVRLAQ